MTCECTSKEHTPECSTGWFAKILESGIFSKQQLADASES